MFDMELEILEPRKMLSSVQIFAAGQTGTEQFQLLINDQIAATFFDVAGNHTERDFVRLEFETPETITGGDAKIRFINDEYRPDEGFDRNLFVSRIVVDGVSYETEHPSTFSSGYWADGGFTGPGFFQTETLNTNGTFTYSDEGASMGTRIEVDARGNTGDEIMQFLVDGIVVREFDVAATDDVYVYQSAEALAADQIRIAFTNDLFAPEIGIDRNLIVEQMRLVDSAATTTYLADAPETFSTGTWLPEDGVAAGFGRGDTLHTNGYLLFDDANATELPDTSFGDNGLAAFEQRGSDPMLAMSATGLIVSGSSTETGRDAGFSEIHVFDADGERVTSFGENGYLRLEFPNLDTLAVMDDGSVLIGNRYPQSLRSEVRKITATGDLDTTFGANGVMVFEAVLQPLVAATSDGGFLLSARRAEPGTPSVVEKYDALGNRDFSYGPNGQVVLPDGFVASHIEFLDWGAAVLSGGTKIAQITPAGWLDQAFGNAGVTDTPFLIRGLEIDSQNRIVVEGQPVPGGVDSGPRLVRFTTEGAVDQGFQQDTLWSDVEGSVYLGGFAVDASDRVVGSFIVDRDLGGGVREYTRRLYRLTRMASQTHPSETTRFMLICRRRRMLRSSPSNSNFTLLS